MLRLRCDAIVDLSIFSVRPAEGECLLPPNTYLDLRSGIVHESHPHAKDAHKLRMREFGKAKKILEQRTALLEGYRESMRLREKQHHNQVRAKL